MQIIRLRIFAGLFAIPLVAATLEGSVSDDSLRTAVRALVAHLPCNQRFTDTAQAFCEERLSRGDRKFGSVRCLDCNTYYTTDVLFLIHNCGRPPQLVRRETV